MTDDEPRRVLRNVQKPGRAPGGVLHADAVKSVAPDSPIQPFIGPGINISGGLQRGVKPSVEDRHLAHPGADDAIHGLNGRQLQPVVRGREFGLLHDCRANLGCDHNASAILGSAVHDAMSHYIDFGGRFNGPGFALPQRLNQGPEKVLRRRRGFPVGTRAPRLSVRHVLKPAFKAAGAPIQDQNLHAPGHLQLRISGMSSPKRET